MPTPELPRRATAEALNEVSAGTLVGLLPETASGFTTIELKANFVGTALAGTLLCEAELRHGGRSTQVWDATVRAEASGMTIALFRCTQLILYRGGPG